jgi:hypothetical protein
MFKPHYTTIPAPSGWTVEVESVNVPLLGILVGVLDFENEVARGDFEDLVTNQAASVRAIYAGGVAPAGATMTAPGGIARNITGVAAAGAANVTEVTITVKDENLDAVAKVHNLDVWLSDDADGEGLTATTASGAVAAKASSGTDLATLVSKKALRVQTKKTGVYVLSITDTAKTAFKVCASINGTAVVLCTLATASYGA